MDRRDGLPAQAVGVVLESISTGQWEEEKEKDVEIPAAMLAVVKTTLTRQWIFCVAIVVVVGVGISC